jgi:hypothetical protein
MPKSTIEGETKNGRQQKQTKIPGRGRRRNVLCVFGIQFFFRKSNQPFHERLMQSICYK